MTCSSNHIVPSLNFNDRYKKVLNPAICPISRFSVHQFCESVQGTF